MEKDLCAIISLSWLLFGCKSLLIEHPHTATIKVVNSAGQGIPDLELYSVYTISSRTVSATTGADGVGVMRFPPGRRQAMVYFKKERSTIGEVSIEFRAGQTNFSGSAELNHYTELDSDGRVLRKRHFTPHVLPP